MNREDELSRALTAAHAEAQRVGDSPLRADRLADRLPAVARVAEATDLPEDLRVRIAAALATAERVLRRDDDGREAARHLQAALTLVGPRSRKPSPFLDDA
jgi:hypothetical protein